MEKATPTPRSFCANWRLEIAGEPRLGSDGALQNSFSEGGRLTFANFVSFCSNFLCFLLLIFLQAFCESVRDSRRNALVS
jgi:hypothetical protein